MERAMGAVMGVGGMLSAPGLPPGAVYSAGNGFNPAIDSGRFQETAPRMPGMGEAYNALQSAIGDAEEIAGILEKRLEPVTRPVPRGNEATGATPMPAVSAIAQALLTIASRIRMVTARLQEAERNLDV